MKAQRKISQPMLLDIIIEDVTSPPNFVWSKNHGQEMSDLFMKRRENKQNKVKKNPVLKRDSFWFNWVVRKGKPDAEKRKLR